MSLNSGSILRTVRKVFLFLLCSKADGSRGLAATPLGRFLPRATSCATSQGILGFLSHLRAPHGLGYSRIYPHIPEVTSHATWGWRNWKHCGNESKPHKYGFVDSRRSTMSASKTAYGVRDSCSTGNAFDTNDAQTVTESSFESRGGGFGWLREFGNGKADVAGLVLSTVFLMTAVAPLSAATDESMAGASAKHELRRTGPAQTAIDTDDTDPSTVAPHVDDAAQNKWHGPARVGTVHVHPFVGNERKDAARVKPILGRDTCGGDDEEHFRGPLTRMACDSGSALRDVVVRGRHIANGQPTDGNQQRGSRANRGQLSTPPLSEDIPDDVGADQTMTHASVLPAAGATTSERTLANGATPGTASDAAFGAAGLASTRASIVPEDNMEESEADIFQTSLPVPVLPESVTDTLRRTLPALMPPAATLFVLISMPVVILLLKGIGTTLVAIAKGYGIGDSSSYDSSRATDGTLEVGFGGPGEENNKRRAGKAAEHPGAAFGLLLGGDRSDTGTVESIEHRTSGKQEMNGEAPDRAMSNRRGKEEDRVSYSHGSASEVHVQTERRGFLDKVPPRSNGSERTVGVGRSQDLGRVSDEVMTAMAMAAMTQELEQMKQALQHEVAVMKSELEQASEESQRLTGKLYRLEVENKQLGAVVSRLGGHDARRLKSQLLSLLAVEEEDKAAEENLVGRVAFA